MSFSLDEITRLAPDEASVKAGEKLAVVSNWSDTGRSENALWGNCKGSGKLPYRVMVDLGNIAFKCSCPSRKFPCKHGLSILILQLRNTSEFTQNPNPEDVQEWLDKRNSRAEKKESSESKSVDPEAKAKRIESREEKVRNGIEELQLWLKDLVRNGIVSIPQNRFQFNANIISRMVDAQAGGLANRLRQFNEIDFSQQSWPEELMYQASSLYLLSETYVNRNVLDEERHSDLEQWIGWNITKEEVLKTDAITGNWMVLSCQQSEMDRLTMEKIWMYSEQDKRFAQLLQFFAPGQIMETHYLANTTIEADVHFYPGKQNLRAIPSALRKTSSGCTVISGFSGITLALDAKTAYRINQPFGNEFPVVFSAVSVVRHNQKWMLKDSDNIGLELINPELEIMKALSITGGKPTSIFGCIHRTTFMILGIWFNSIYYSF